MTEKTAVLVVGGAGYIGSHVSRWLRERGRPVVVLDDLSSGHADAVLGAPLVVGDMADSALLADTLRRHQVGAVLHFASLIQVGESIAQPGRYYENNIAKTISLLNALVAENVKKLVFSSTAAIFQASDAPLAEQDTQAPLNPYGRSKWLLEQLLPDYERAHGLRSVCLRYFNAAGAHPDGQLGERHDPETHLIPLAIEAALGRRQALQVFGGDYPTPDGTCVRDYVHVQDLADAHERALQYLEAGGASAAFNLGNGQGFSVREVLAAVALAVGRAVPHHMAERRAGDPPRLVADARLAGQVLGWRPQYPALADIVRHAVQFHTQSAALSGRPAHFSE